MKVAISIPDAVFERGESAAKRMKKSRSQLYADAVAEYLDRHDPDAITEAYNRLADEIGDEDLDWVDATSREVLKRVEW